MSKSPAPYQRPHAVELARRRAELRRFVQVVAGARQVGKTTLVQQVTEAANVPVRFASADEPTLRGAEWIVQRWEAARLAAGPEGAILVLDEVKKAVGWSESVKRLWDEDTRARRPLKVVLARPRTAARPAGPHRKRRRTLRGAPPAALVVYGNESGIRLAA